MSKRLVLPRPIIVYAATLSSIIVNETLHRAILHLLACLVLLHLCGGDVHDLITESISSM